MFSKFVLAVFIYSAGSCVARSADYGVKDSAVSRVCPINTNGASDKNVCVCGATAQGIFVTCTNVSSRLELASSLKNLEGYSLVQLGMVKVNLTVVPQDFKGIKFLKMDVESSELRVNGPYDSFIFNDDNDNRLRVVQFRKSTINLGDSTLADTADLAELSSLEFDDCSFDNYQESWFKKVATTKLRIVRSPLIVDPIARDIIGLQEYKYTKSGLTNLTSWLMPVDRSQITALDFSENAITEISAHFLKHLPKLEKINLSGNKLTSLSANTFKHFDGEISASGNPFVCNDELLWLKTRLDNGTLQHGDLITCCLTKPDGSRVMIPVISMPDSLPTV